VNRVLGCLVSLVVAWLLLLAVAMGLIELAGMVAGFLLWMLGG
jgi:hypothetical protein